MAEDWSAIAAEVRAGLAEVGFQATLVRAGGKTGPAHDPVFGQPTKHPLTVMQDTISLGLIDVSAIRAGDKLVMAAAGGVVPTTADRVVLAPPQGVTITGSDLPGLAIARVEPFAPGGVPLYFEMLLRG